MGWKIWTALGFILLAIALAVARGIAERGSNSDKEPPMSNDSQKFTQSEIDLFNKVLSMNNGFRSLREVADELGVPRLKLLDGLEAWDKAGRPQSPKPDNPEKDASNALG